MLNIEAYLSVVSTSCLNPCYSPRVMAVRHEMDVKLTAPFRGRYRKKRLSRDAVELRAVDAIKRHVLARNGRADCERKTEVGRHCRGRTTFVAGTKKRASAPPPPTTTTTSTRDQPSTGRASAQLRRATISDVQYRRSPSPEHENA